MTSEQLALNIRRHALEMTHISKGSHIASVFSCAEILSVLYNDIMKIYPSDPKNEARDRFVLSKGHAGAGIYAVLAEKGFFEKERLLTHYADGSLLSGHVSHKGIPGVEFSTGSLGHGICAAAGMAYAAKNDGKTHRVFCMIGDGECDEGSVWEAALFSNHYRLSNFTVIIDHNKMQSLDYCEKTLEFIDMAGKWRAFGWDVVEIDGHDCSKIRAALNMPRTCKPLCVIAHTVKGKGVSFMENDILWHYKDPQDKFYEDAKKELWQEKL
ncbi:MAG TPA: transketolase [Candidatus Goldiibacteriota bacterium]|nr:transketolase [Candidatus Goldiibacteriota bacterium]